jgi:hypothetical protein
MGRELELSTSPTVKDEAVNEDTVKLTLTVKCEPEELTLHLIDFISL